MAASALLATGAPTFMSMGMCSGLCLGRGKVVSVTVHDNPVAGAEEVGHLRDYSTGSQFV